jgi:hypothetical protein
MSVQCASSLLMVKPRFFRGNPETIASNSFQKEGNATDLEDKAISEFEHVVKRLRKYDIHVLESENEDVDAPDAVFPNNWVSFHADGSVVLYPMMAPSRRKERNKKILDQVASKFQSSNIIDLTHWEEKEKFLEGTGSVIFDHVHKIAYSSISPRTHIEVLDELCSKLGYKKFIFHAVADDLPVYHTNVVMHIGEKYAVVCLDAIHDAKERNELRRMLAFTGHEVLSISLAQMRKFAGNMLEICNDAGKHYTLLSSQAIRSLHLPQINTIAENSELLSFDLSTIENYGGGSIRCMVAEIFCPVKSVHG